MKYKLILFIFLLAAGRALAAEDAGGVFHTLSEGISPAFSAQQFLSAREGLNSRFAELHSAWAGEALYTQNPSCARYAKVIHRLAGQITDSARMLESISSRERLYVRARLHLLTPLYFGLHSLFLSGREGGFSVLDDRQTLPCPFFDRGKVEIRFTRAVRELAAFAREGLGHPGLSGIDQMNGELLAHARTARDRRTSKQWGLLAATAATSVIFWQAAPTVAIAATRLVFAGSVPPVLESGVAVFGIRTAALAAEGLVYDQFDRRLLPPGDAGGRTRLLGSWDDQINEAETLLDSPLSSPELYLAGLTQIQAQLASLYLPWLRHHSELHNTPAAAYAREASALAGLTLEQSAERLRQRVQAEFGYCIECASGLVGGVDDLSCFAGMRAVARMLYDARDLPRLEAAQNESLKLIVSPEPGARRVVLDDHTEIHLGHGLAPQMIHSEIRSALASPAFAKDTSVARAFASELANLEANSPVAIEFDPSLSRMQKWKFIRRLMAAAAPDPGLLDRGADVLFITKDFRPAHQAGQRVEEHLSAFASAAEIQTFLRQAEH